MEIMKLEKGALKDHFEYISNAQEELEQEGYYVEINGKLIDPSGDIYTPSHPVMQRAEEIRRREGRLSSHNGNNPCDERVLK